MLHLMSKVWTLQTLPHPQSLAYYNGGKIIIKMSRGTGKDPHLLAYYIGGKLII